MFNKKAGKIEPPKELLDAVQGEMKKDISSFYMFKLMLAAIDRFNLFEIKQTMFGQRKIFTVLPEQMAEVYKSLTFLSDQTLISKIREDSVYDIFKNHLDTISVVPELKEGADKVKIELEDLRSFDLEIPEYDLENSDYFDFMYDMLPSYMGLNLDAYDLCVDQFKKLHEEMNPDQIANLSATWNDLYEPKSIDNYDMSEGDKFLTSSKRFNVSLEGNRFKDTSSIRIDFGYFGSHTDKGRKARAFYGFEGYDKVEKRHLALMGVRLNTSPQDLFQIKGDIDSNLDSGFKEYLISLRHELIHATQRSFNYEKGGRPVKPSKSSPYSQNDSERLKNQKKKELLQEGVPESSINFHALDDIEFYTLLDTLLQTNYPEGYLENLSRQQRTDVFTNLLKSKNPFISALRDVPDQKPKYNKLVKLLYQEIVNKPADKNNADWARFVQERYEGGKARLPNPNPKTVKSFPDIAFSTALKYPKTRDVIHQEYEQWLKNK
jgi:hypothetical protein